jgi:hypothetical protein
MNRTLRSLRILSIATGVITSVGLAGPIATAIAQDQNADLRIVGDQVRSQGFACSNPTSAERIEAESAPNKTVYVLKCEGVTYRVVLIPDQAADVTEVK